MQSNIQIFGSDTITDLLRSNIADTEAACKYLTCLIKNGASFYIDNARVQVKAVLVDDQLLPLVVSEASDNSDICSPTAHYLRYPLAELHKRKQGISKFLLKSLLHTTTFFLQKTELDKVIYLNNWLWTTNPSPNLTTLQIQNLTNYLIQEYPDHVILFRTCNRHVAQDYFHALAKAHYKMVASRTVYLAFPDPKIVRKNENVRKDQLLLKKSGYEILSNEDLDEIDIARMTSLYRNLYLNKHPRLNPQYNENFFSLVVRENIFTFKALKKEGRIDAFVAYYSRDGVMTGTLVGYDLELPQKLGLYRQAFAMLMSVGASQIVNLSAGAGLFKIFRGARPCIEYDAVYDSHVSYSRRLAWSCIQAGGIFQRLRAYGRRLLA